MPTLDLATSAASDDPTPDDIEAIWTALRAMIAEDCVAAAGELADQPPPR